MRMLAACFAACLVLSGLECRALGWSWLILLSSGLTVAVMYVAASVSRARRWQLFWLLAALYGGIGVINIQIEALAFGMFPPVTIARNIVSGLAQVAVVSAILTFGATRGDEATETGLHGMAGSLWWRAPAVALTYVVLFLVTGSLAFPFIRNFYASTNVIVMPSLGLLLGAEFVRGFVYVGALALLMRRVPGHRGQAALVAGLALSVLGGVAPLLLPVDNILSAEVRRIHMLEIVCANFLLGVVAGFLLVRRARSHSTHVFAVSA